MAYLFSLIPNDVSFTVSSGMNDGELFFPQRDNSFFNDYRGVLFEGRFIYTPSSSEASIGNFKTPSDFNTLQNFFINSSSGISLHFSLNSITDNTSPPAFSSGFHNLFFVSSGTDIEYNYKSLLNPPVSRLASHPNFSFFKSLLPSQPFPVVLSSHTPVSSHDINFSHSYVVVGSLLNLSIYGSGQGSNLNDTFTWTLKKKNSNGVFVTISFFTFTGVEYDISYNSLSLNTLHDFEVHADNIDGTTIYSFSVFKDTIPPQVSLSYQLFPDTNSISISSSGSGIDLYNSLNWSLI